MTKGKYIFIGEDGSLGFLRGVVYWLEVESVEKRPVIVFPRTCPYESWGAFHDNWRIA